MKSIQTKLLILIVGSILMCALLIGGISIFHSKQVIDQDSAKIMNLQCANKAGEINALLLSIEQSVKILSVYVDDKIKGTGQNGLQQDYNQRIQNMALDIANNTEGSIAFYVRFSPEVSSSTSGFFWARRALEHGFEEMPPTDLSKYAPDDIKHVGWYYIPKQEGKPVWLTPYQNENIGILMISYVIPIYRENQFIGVVGMDIDFSVIQKMVSDISVYDTGYAFLSDATATIMYHREIELYRSMGDIEASLIPVAHELQNKNSGEQLFHYLWKGDAKMMVFDHLENDMRLVLTAPSSEINSARQKLIFQILIAFLSVTTLFAIITYFYTRRLIRPLKELNLAAGKIAAGDLSIHISSQSMDEVGTLAASFQKTADHLKQHMEYINGLAYRDSLTGAKNKAAYQEEAQRLDYQLKTAIPHFGIAMFDINGLKTVNDTYGHEMGDRLIVDSCRLICNAFKHSPVYRIGGDEFVAILERSDYEHRDDCLAELKQSTNQYNETVPPQFQVFIACGLAYYDMDTDHSFSDVFNRADTMMYENKHEMKQRNETPFSHQTES